MTATAGGGHDSEACLTARRSEARPLLPRRLRRVSVYGTGGSHGRRVGACIGAGLLSGTRSCGGASREVAYGVLKGSRGAYLHRQAFLHSHGDSPLMLHVLGPAVCAVCALTVQGVDC